MGMIFHSHVNKTHFHMKGCALGLTLKVRVFGTRKWPIHYFYINHDAPCSPSKILHTVFIRLSALGAY